MFGFAPSGARGRDLDAAVRARLASSLDAIVDTLDGRLGVDPDEFRALTAAVRSHPVQPGVMALYAELVPAFSQDHEAAERILADLAAPGWRRRAEPRVVTVRDADLGPGMANCYLRHLNDDPDASMELTALDDTALAQGSRRLADATRLLEAAFPELAEEVAALVSEVLLAGPASDPGTMTFHGASNFYLWGALLLNLDAHPTRVRLVEGLAHESAHSLLHGITMGKPMVANEPGERYRSPLRDDPRPMDGIVHATFVLARMHLAVSALLRSDGLTAAERNEAGTRRTAVARDYAEGLAIVARNAKFTPEGAETFAGAQRYMADVS